MLSAQDALQSRWKQTIRTVSLFGKKPLSNSQIFQKNNVILANLMGKWNRNKSKKRRWQKNHLINKYGNFCALCRISFNSMKEITFDHIIPMSRGGVNELENLQLVHLHCNHAKADMLPEEFEIFQKGGKLVE